MKTQVKTILKVSEKEAKYEAGNSDKNVLLWVVNSDGAILLRNPKREQSANSPQKICELTLEADHLKDLLFKIEKETGILTSDHNIHKIKNASKTYDVYFLNINLDKHHKEVVENHYNGKFIDYREIMNSLRGVKITSTCKESLLNLISTLYEKYNFL